MNEAQSKTPNMLTGDVTLDATPPGPSASAAGDSSPSRERRGQVALVAGSGPKLTRETEALLRGRLRLAAALMFLGFLVFLPQHLLNSDFSLPGRPFLLGFHVVVTIVLALVCGLLWRRREISMFRLRVTELVIFVLAAAFQAVMQHLMIVEQCRELCQLRDRCQHLEVSLPAGLWLCLLFTYALFVPNNWRRAAIVIGALAATPVAAILLMMWFRQEVREAIAISELSRFVLLMAFSAVTGVFGVDTIGSLRRQVFEARQLGQYRLLCSQVSGKKTAFSGTFEQPGIEKRNPYFPGVRRQVREFRMNRFFGLESIRKDRRIKGQAGIVNRHHWSASEIRSTVRRNSAGPVSMRRIAWLTALP